MFLYSVTPIDGNGRRNLYNAVLFTNKEAALEYCKLVREGLSVEYAKCNCFGKKPDGVEKAYAVQINEEPDEYNSYLEVQDAVWYWKKEEAIDAATDITRYTSTGVETTVLCLVVHDSVESAIQFDNPKLYSTCRVALVWHSYYPEYLWDSDLLVGKTITDEDDEDLIEMES